LLYSSEHRTENIIHAYDNFEKFITGEGLAAVPSLLYSSAVGKACDQGSACTNIILLNFSA